MAFGCDREWFFTLTRGRSALSVNYHVDLLKRKSFRWKFVYRCWFSIYFFLFCNEIASLSWKYPELETAFNDSKFNILSSVYRFVIFCYVDRLFNLNRKFNQLQPILTCFLNLKKNSNKSISISRCSCIKCKEIQDLVDG